MLKPLLCLLILVPSIVVATPDGAERIKRSHELSSKQFVLESKLAATPEARQALLGKRPDTRRAAGMLWEQIGRSLQETWTIPYAAYFLEISRGLAVADENGNPREAFAKERAAVLKTISANHLKTPGITSFVIALVDAGDPQSLPILEKIIDQNPDEKVQGVAALGAALLLKSLGDEPELMKKRLTYLRTAIIQAADQEIGERSVADIASDELYVIRFLVKGREAPPLSGADVGGRMVKISDFRGKILVLLFWDAKSADTDRVIQLTNQLNEKYTGQPVVVLGVTPEDVARIRTLQADGSISWNNIHDPSDKLAQEYKIASRPAVFVLDQKGVIEFTGLPGSFVELTVDALLVGEE